MGSSEGKQPVCWCASALQKIKSVKNKAILDVWKNMFKTQKRITLGPATIPETNVLSAALSANYDPSNYVSNVL